MTHPGKPAYWQVLRDTTAPTQPYVLAQTSAADDQQRIPVAVMDGVMLKDGDVSVMVKPVAGTHDQAAGLVWRYQDAGNYYVARANALRNSVAVFKVVNGKSVQIAHAVKREIPTNQWSTLKAVFRGASLDVYINHRRVLSTKDDTFPSAGRVGLSTEGASVAYFDNLRIVEK